ncbi:MAG: acetylornithine transaminase [Actinobacteria bacterium]|nr:acetylornithine transaminase [Actinomycetota bacterium]
MTTTADALARWQASIADTYGTPGMVLVRGDGATVWDAEGHEYLDLLAGIAVNALGHAHPAVIEAVTRQLATLGHTSNLAATLPGIELAERLLQLSGRRGRVFFANSGAEANEAAFKLGRLTGRSGVVAALGGFHGRTAAALAVTGQQAKRSPFEPLVPTVRFVPYGDASSLAKAVDESVAAILLEPIQGEGGVVVPPAGYLAEARRIAESAGALFIVDEVQTGIGRTGRWFAHQAESVMPDAMTLAKGLGGGLPIGALLTFDDAAELWRPGMHGSTFGGNPVSCAAALAVLDTIEAEALLDHADAMGSRLRRSLAAQPGVQEVRGRGLLLGVVLEPGLSAADVQSAARERGLIVNAIGTTLIRLAPPLVISENQIDDAAGRLAEAIDVARRSGEAGLTQ